MHNVLFRFGSWGDAEKLWELLLWGKMAVLTKKKTGRILFDKPSNEHYISIHLSKHNERFSTSQGEDFSHHQHWMEVLVKALCFVHRPHKGNNLCHGPLKVLWRH